MLDQAVELYRGAGLPRIEPFAELRDFVAASMRVIAEVGDGEEAARRIANLGPLGPGLVPEEARRRMIAASVPVQAWPERRLAITAVDAASGRRVTFDADSGVALRDAVAASGALPWASSR